MAELSSVQSIVYDAMDRVNQDLPAGQRMPLQPDTPLLGVRSMLDSLLIINLLVSIEDGVRGAFGARLALMEDPVVLTEGGPLSTAGALAEYIRQRV